MGEGGAGGRGDGVDEVDLEQVAGEAEVGLWANSSRRGLVRVASAVRWSILGSNDPKDTADPTDFETRVRRPILGSLPSHVG